MNFNEQETKKALSVLKQDDEIFEIRILEGKIIHSGYFKDIDKAIDALKKYNIDFEQGGVYFTLQKVNEACYSRSQKDKFIKNSSNATSDSDILSYDWIFIDLDPKRPSGISATDEELEYAKYTANKIYRFLYEHGFYSPIVTLSGNGVHLLYKVDIKNNAENAMLINNFLKTLSFFFSDDRIDIDVKTGNPARICKLYGTMAQKGVNTADRPHRESKIIRVPDEVISTPIESIQEIAKSLNVEQPAKNKYINPEFDLDQFIQDNGIRIEKTVRTNGATKYVLSNCLFDESHKAPDACIFKLDNGAIAYKCFHNSCDNHKWQDVRLMFEPDAYNKQYVDYNAKPNHNTQNYKSYKVEEVSSTIPDGKDGFLTTSEIYESSKNAPAQEFLKTGITVLDEKMRGLQKGFVSVFSGLRASGKSTLLSQLALNMAENGYKTALYSGELTPIKTLQWLTRQCAGKEGLIQTQEGFYEVKRYAKEKISSWLSDKIYIFNNDYGHNFENLYKSLNKCVEERKVDLIILDNLMTLDISYMDSDKYQRQSELVGRLEIFSKKNNVHVILVAHPRKSPRIFKARRYFGKQ